jgi:phage nucleotide-binding protein
MRKRTVVKKPSSILDKVEPVSSLSLIVTALFYGKSGTGKTTISGTFPKPLLVIDIGERGTDSLADEDDVDVIKIETWAEFEELYWELKESKHKYKSASIDAVHSLQGLALNEVKAIANKDANAQTSQRDFGQASGLLNTWIINFRDLRDIGINVVFLAHDRINEIDVPEGEDGIMPDIGPRLMPSVASCLTGSVNIVGNTYIKEIITKSKKVGEKASREVQYCLRLGPNGVYSTKIRSPKKFATPEFIVDPDYDKLCNVIQGRVSKPTRTRNSINRNRNK